MRILVTGAAGFIGSHIAEELLKIGHTVIGVDDLSGGTRENVEPFTRTYRDNFRFYSYDLGVSELVLDVFMAHRPEIIVHCAANAREGASFYCPQQIAYRNLMISSLLLELGILSNMKRIVFFSSMSVYGNGKPPFDEKNARKPIDPYGVNKMAVEMMIEQLAPVHGFSYNIIRPHNVIGPRQSMSDPYRNVAGIFMNRILRKEPLYIFGEGHTRAFSFIGDSLPCYMKAILDENISGEIVNVGGKEKITIDELATAVLTEMIGPDASYEIHHVEERHGEVTHAFSTTQKSEDLLGYREDYGWREGVRIMAQWAKKIGPQPWKFSPLPLMADSMPQPWKQLHVGHKR